VRDKSSTATTPAPNRLDRPVTSMTTGESIAAAYGVRAVPLAATAARAVPLAATATRFLL
jgi:hypothetical protein